MYSNPSLFDKHVGIYSFHEHLNLKEFRNHEKRLGTDLNDYVIDIQKKLLANNILLHEIRDVKRNNFLDTVIFIDVADPDLILRKYNVTCKKKILILKEPPVIQPNLWKKNVVKRYHYILTYNKNFIKKFKNTTNMIFSLMPRNLNFRIFENSKKKFLCMFASNKISKKKNELYSYRKMLIKYFIKNNKNSFDLYGPDWNFYLISFGNYVIKIKRFFKIPFWKGVVPNKLKVMSHYTFSFCCENVKDFDGYISEKIFDSMRSGCIPVYCGPKNISIYVPKNCFIDASEFSSIDKLILFLENLNETKIKKYQKNILVFISKKASKNFSLANFSKKIAHIASL